ncbi:hypothetical protein O7626_03135 [Micromonospora sp. WMMD1102]|uniref:hypothetical protein n=1 Tax=Micromonospora sp. WMMD1102 TaxID=3016105 RepID=UPI002414D706|nr:hypothetical protein [Micromonospora sp. WMMD1102]MDG4784935.1 hypothetical protein [Micromonospora sp. WMMD1102]
MNQYAAQAQTHWKKYLPNRYQQIGNPDEFFTALGEQIAQQIEDLSRTLAGPDPEQETYLDKLGRLNNARLRAEGQVLREMLPDPETDLSPTR